MRELTLKEIQASQLELMRKVDKVCREQHINYYLISGSCLGAVRHGGFIPWDDDIDIGMLRCDYERFISGFRDWFDTDRYFLQNEMTDKDFIWSLSRICILGTELDMPWATHLKFNKSMFMDIFPLDNVPDEEKDRDWQRKKIKFYNKLLARKVFSLSGNRVKDEIKKIVSFCLGWISLSAILIKRREVITRYDKINTKCVCSMASKYGYRKHIMDRNIYGSPIELNFQGEKFCFPENYNEHLRLLFGENYMNLPPVEKREKATKVYVDK